MRLGPGAALPPDVALPAYDRTEQRRGVVHLGIGAFHRAHQAVYTDDALNGGDRDWAITGVSLLSPGVAEALNPQGGLYTVNERDGAGERARLIGAVAEVLVADRSPEAVLGALASPDTRIVTLTITEKGYAPGPDGAPPPAVRWLVEGLARRHAAGIGGVTLISCDNLAENGAALRALIEGGLEARDPALAVWFAAECATPSSMVDRIVPATTPADLDAVEARLGLRDEGAVVTEPFRQWVIEDRFAGPRPRWELGGAKFVADVRPYEAAKLRMLNGAHSAMAYLGLARGHRYVHEAVGDPAIAPLVDRLMRQEAAPSVDPAPGQDLQAYADDLQSRWTNAALPHRLTQIAIDGSKKIPQRWLAPLAINAAAGRSCPATLSALAAWIVHVRGDGHQVDDPAAAELAALWRRAGRDGVVAALFGESGRFRDLWVATAENKAEIQTVLDALI